MLKVEIITIDDKWSVAKFTELKDLINSNHFEWTDNRTEFFIDKIYINQHDPHTPFLVYNENLFILENLVKVINTEPMVWRAKLSKRYYYIDNFGEISSNCDTYSPRDDNRYNLGNYFQTEKDAQKVLDSKEWRDFWSNVRNREVGNE